MATKAATPAPPADPFLVAWQTRWQAIKGTTAQYHPDWGIERAWRTQADAWGPVLDLAEIPYTWGADSFKGRVFLKVGLVLWDPAAGPVVVGWPADPAQQ